MGAQPDLPCPLPTACQCDPQGSPELRVQPPMAVSAGANLQWLGAAATSVPRLLWLWPHGLSLRYSPASSLQLSAPAPLLFFLLLWRYFFFHLILASDPTSSSLIT